MIMFNMCMLVANLVFAVRGKVKDFMLKRKKKEIEKQMQAYGINRPRKGQGNRNS